MLRIVLGIIVGTVVAVLVVTGCEMIGHRIWPPSAEMNPQNLESIRAVMGKRTVGALMSVAVAWTLGAFIGGVVGALIARRTIAAWIVGGFIIAASVANLIMLPHPIWMWGVVGLVLPAVTWLAGRITKR